MAILEKVGFEAIRVGDWRWNAFDGAPSQSSAAEFGTEGIVIYARKPTRKGHAMDSKYVPAADAVLDAPGAACTILTPLIKARIRDLESGRVLEVRSDDPAAREGVPAWSRLTGNPLVAIVEDDAERTRFYLRKK